MTLGFLRLWEAVSMFSTKATLLVLAVFCLAGCSGFRPTQLQDSTAASPSVDVPAREIIVVDLTKPNAEHSDSMLTTGFRRLADRAFATPLGDTLRVDLVRLLKPVGTSGPMEVSILDVGFYWEKTGADFIPVVNAVTYGRNGRFMCSAVVNVKLESVSRRVAIERIVPLTTEGVEPGETIYKPSSRYCYGELVSVLAKKIAEEQ